jgi:hypothetical protein
MLLLACATTLPERRPVSLTAPDSVRIWEHTIRAMHTEWATELTGRGLVTCLFRNSSPDSVSVDGDVTAVLQAVADLRPRVVAGSECAKIETPSMLKHVMTGDTAFRAVLLFIDDRGGSLRGIMAWFHGGGDLLRHCSAEMRTRFHRRPLRAFDEDPIVVAECWD